MNEESELIGQQLVFEDELIPSPISNQHKMIPVKSICSIVGIDFSSQDRWLKSNEFFQDIYTIVETTGADGKTRNMRCLPAYYILAWIAGVEQKNRKQESIQKQLKFMFWLREQLEGMYKLIEVFKEENRYELQLMAQKIEKLESINELKKQVKDLEREVKKIEVSLVDVREAKFSGNRELPFPKEGK